MQTKDLILVIEDALNRIDYLEFLQDNNIETIEYIFKKVFPNYQELYDKWGKELVDEQFAIIFEKWDEINYKSHCL